MPRDGRFQRGMEHRLLNPGFERPTQCFQRLERSSETWRSGWSVVVDEWMCEWIGSRDRLAWVSSSRRADCCPSFDAFN